MKKSKDVNEQDVLIWRGYFDGEPSVEEKEILNVACSEVLADFPIIKVVEEEYKSYVSIKNGDVAIMGVFKVGNKWGLPLIQLMGQFRRIVLFLYT